MHGVSEQRQREARDASASRTPRRCSPVARRIRTSGRHRPGLAVSRHDRPLRQGDFPGLLLNRMHRGGVDARARNRTRVGVVASDGSILAVIGRRALPVSRRSISDTWSTTTFVPFPGLDLGGGALRNGPGAVFDFATFSVQAPFVNRFARAQSRQEKMTIPCTRLPEEGTDCESHTVSCERGRDGGLTVAPLPNFGPTPVSPREP